MNTQSLSLLALLLCCHTASAQTALYQLQGSVPSGEFGRASALAGDLNGDGLDDFFIGEPCASGGAPCNGKVSAHSGGTGAMLWEVSSLPGGPELRLGERMTALDDVTGDGVPDLVCVVLADAGGSTDTMLQIRSGADGALIGTEFLVNGSMPSPALPPDSRLSQVGDVNGDSLPDFIVGLPEAANGGFVGRFDIRSGADATLIRRVDADAATLKIGFSVAGVGDVTGDGIGDYAAGSPDPGSGMDGPGWVRVYNGATGDLLYTVVGATSTSGLGVSIASIGDVNSDGVGDIVMGALGSIADLFPGGIYVISGVDGATLHVLNGMQGEGLGTSTSSAGDFNQDGSPDFASGASTEFNGGIVRIYSGVDASVLASVTGGPSAGTQFGYVLQGGGDLNGDGFDDLLVSDAEFGDNGTVSLIARDVPNGGTLCKGLPNSTGQRAALSVTSPSGFSASANDVAFSVTQLPTNSTGYFIVSPSFNVVPNPGGSVGRICIASTQIGRYRGSVLNSGATGSVNFAIDTTMIPIVTPGGPTQQVAMAGSVYNFQFWYRHSVGMGGVSSNFSDAVTTRFN